MIKGLYLVVFQIKDNVGLEFSVWIPMGMNLCKEVTLECGIIQYD